MIGTTVGSYRILSKLSVGGMGTVYRAEHVLIGKAAAVKVLNAELCTNTDVVNRFLNEARAATSIKHPGIVEVFDFGHMETGHAYLTMEYLEGMSLARRIKTRGKMPEGEAAMLLRAVCNALQAAHAKGIVHRDLKPDNIFLVIDPDSATGERPKLLDFGIAKLTDVGLAGQTKTGAVMGTPTYMSPEQCSGNKLVDHRADLYSLGCVLYELVTGRPPFTGRGAGELIGAHLYVEPDRPSVSSPGIDVGTETLIMALLAKRPEDRPQTARELGQRLTEIAQHQGWITPTAPNGITAPVLAPLVPRQATTEVDERHAGTVETLPSKPPGAVTPQGLTPPALFVDDDPMLDVPPQSRLGLQVAVGAAALLAAGIVAFFALRGGGADPAEPVRPAAAAVVAPPPTPPRPAPVEAPKPAVVVVEPAKPPAEPPKPAIAAARPTAAPQKPAKLTVKPKPQPAAEKQPTLLETDL